MTTSDRKISKDVEKIGERYRQVRDVIDRVASTVGRDPTTVRLIVATKTVSLPSIESVLHQGARELGESRLQEALPKISALNHFLPPISWHFIGRLQRRKVKSVVSRFDLIHSVDSLELADEIDRRAREIGSPQKVLLEINQGLEPKKGGFAPDSILEALPHLDSLTHLQIEGLMSIPPYSDCREDARPFFSQLRQLAEQAGAGPWKRIQLRELSMGMSQDYDIAVQEGATMVRVGTKIFGTRHD